MYKKREHIHFMGIGGIGMSGIAEILRLRGYTVSGCDLATGTKTLQHLQTIGCTIHHKHADWHVHDADVLVYSSAVNKQDGEVLAALSKGIPVIARAIMLAELMRSKFSVAISGAHGKTTTTSLISHIMIEAGKQPTIVVGGVVKNMANNAQLGEGEIFIAEADESDRSLLYLSPSVAVVTNIDAEHLDTYKDLDDIKNTFKDFLARIPFYGKAFVCLDDQNIRSILPLQHVPTVAYGLSSDADVMGDNVVLDATSSSFDVYERSCPSTGSGRALSEKDSVKIGAHPELVEGSPIFKKEKKFLGRITASIPGIHNVRNCLAAIAVCREFDVSFAVISQALATFKGVERRFEFKGTIKGAEIFDDYGHHPVEIKSTLLVAKKRANKRLHVVFQPHRFTRTEKLWDDFVNVFADHQQDGYPISTLYITDIYPASEAPIPGITSEKLVSVIKEKNPALQVHYVSTYDQITRDVEQVIQEGDLVLTIGAGKINQVGETLLKK